jgi:hypothetical protein
LVLATNPDDPNVTLEVPIAQDGLGVADAHGLQSGWPWQMSGWRTHGSVEQFHA